MTENYNDDKPKDKIWYKNPIVLISNMDEFFPTNDLSKINKINAIFRFALYYSIIIIVVYISEPSSFSLKY